MPLSWNEIQNRAAAFAEDFKAARHERSEAQTFWNRFFAVFGVDSRRVGVFESRVKKLNKKPGFADYFWPGLLLIEHKSRGEDLLIASDQAADYCINLKEEEQPRYLLVCDFEHFWLKDVETGSETRFVLQELPQKVSLFAFILGQQSVRIRPNDLINEQAVKKLARLHTALRQDGYKGHPLQLLLVRLLFCMFADKTGLFEPAGRFTDLIERGTAEDGSNVGQMLTQLFDELDTEFDERQGKVPGWFKDFPYVNGKLFEEKIRTASFDDRMRELLLDCCYLDWARISPAVFGAMFQHIMDEEGIDTKHDLRRELGAHYTSEENILKLIGPLFLDDLKAELERAKGSIKVLFEFQKKLRYLHFLDPACGCGNFLVVTYRELRLLEIEVLKAVKDFGHRGAALEEGFQAVMVDVDQFNGIEIEEFPARVAQVALWLVDHQMNILAGEVLAAWLPRLPLKKSANIRIGDALALDWADFCPPESLNYILGNPPFVGKQLQNEGQKDSMERLLAGAGIKGGGVLDFVAGWYIKATQYLTDAAGAAKADERKKEFKDAAFAKATQASILEEPLSEAELAAQKSADELFALIEAQSLAAREKIKVAFVSTNSICQGEQVGVLWGWMLGQGIAIEFAHRTFKWSNEASGKAAVHCVIVGFGLKSRVEKVSPKRLFDYLDEDGEREADGALVEEKVSQINPYLVDAPNFVLPSRSKPLCDAPATIYGSKPADGGHLILSDEEYQGFIKQYPAAQDFIRPLISAEEYLNGQRRWCIWLKDVNPAAWQSITGIRQRVREVKKFRSVSTKQQTRDMAEQPSLFAEIRQPANPYVLIPLHSSENRPYIPLGYCHSDQILHNSCSAVPNATLYHFGVLTSAMHMAWMRYTCGRLKSDYRYSNSIVYNNFPWPEDVANKEREGVEVAAQAVLDTRALHQKGANPASLATLYAPDLMPTDLRNAHAQLDRLVDKAYGFRVKGRQALDAQRVALLFERYQVLVASLERAQQAQEGEKRK